MKHLIIPLFTFTFILQLAASAAVPLRWTVETSRATPAQFEAYQGETLALEAALQSYGKPLEAPSNYSLYWQTNGMGNVYWSAPCPSSATTTNVLFATWFPTNDVGAKVYNCFIGQPGTIYHAAFQLRLRPSPGATPNELPLPQKVIDFAKVTVLNPPWESGGGGVNTNAVRDIAREEIDPATNRLYKTLIDAMPDGAARPLPKYLWLYNADDSYPDEAAAYYASRGNGKADGGCSSVRDGGFLYRNFDYPFDDRAEFVVKMSAGKGRFASVGVAQVGTNLTEQIVTSGKPEYSRLYKWLPGATVDGINENGVACNINVVDGDPQASGWHNDTGDLHPLAAIRWILDNATNAQQAAEYIASHIAFPQGWTQNFHYMIADESATFIVEDGYVRPCEPGAFLPILTNYRIGIYDPNGSGQERWDALYHGANITNVWYTNAYRRETNPPWVSDLAEVIAYTNEIFDAWATHPKEYFRGKTTNGQPWWQTVHTSVYNLTNRVLRVAVQEQDDWYTFQVPSSGAKIDAYTKSETDAKLAGKASVDDLGRLDSRVQQLGDALGTINLNTRALGGGDWYVDGDVYTLNGDMLSAKANRAAPGDDGELATLDEDGNPTRSGIAKDDVALQSTVDDIDARVYQNESDIADLYDSRLPLINPGPVGTVEVYDFDDTPGDVVLLNGNHSLRAKADRSMISATDPTFSNEVATVARTVTPQPSPTLRLYDEVRQCWWIGRMVNGVINWEVE